MGPATMKRAYPPTASGNETVTLADVEAAARVIAGAVLDTDFDHSRTLSEMIGADVWLKFDNLQFTASFKERGARYRFRQIGRAHV